MDYDNVFHHLRRGEQRNAAYLAINPQGLVPALVLPDGQILTQSLAICEYLDSLQSEPPLLPTDEIERARVRAFAQVIVSDTHPIQNLKILNRLRDLDLTETQVNVWAGQIIEAGLAACEALLPNGRSDSFCFGDRPTLADLCLVPQLANARRFGVDIHWPRLVEIEARCSELSAFRETAPEQQPDAE